MSTNVLLPTLLILVALLCLRMLREIGGGQRIIRVSRRSPLDVEKAWRNLRAAWQATALTFQPAKIAEQADGLRIVRTRDGEIAIEPLDPPADHSVIFRVRTVDGAAYLPGTDHFEHWRIESDGAGSKIVIETRFKATLGGTVSMLLGLWRQAGAVAAPMMTGTTGSHAGRTGPFAPAAASPQASRRTPPAGASAGYGREAIMSLLAFAYLLTQFSWQNAVMLAAVILWHEYGHLLAYRLTGRTGNRMMLVPFFGGIAVAGAPHRNEFERAFCALMGPGICAPLTLGAFALWYYDIAPEYDAWFWGLFYFSSIVNLLNLLPIFPLDGGQAAESFLRSFLPGSIAVHLSGLAVAGIILLVGMRYYEMAVFVGVFAFLGLRGLPQRSRLPAMSGRQAAAMALFYAAIAAAHGSVFYSIS